MQRMHFAGKLTLLGAVVVGLLLALALVPVLAAAATDAPLLAAARARGNRTVNGLGMLLNQARPAFEAWFGVMPSITPGLRRAIEATF